MHEKWNAVDWSKNDTTIAKEMGLSRERVRQARNKLGKPKVQLPQVQRRNARLTQLKELDTTDMNILEIAELLGVSTSQARLDLAKLGRYSGKGYKRQPHPGGPRKYDWDNVDWENKSNVQLARELGDTWQRIGQARLRHGKPKGPDGRKQRVDWGKADWSQPNDVIAKQLGCAPSTVRRIRSERGNPRK